MCNETPRKMRQEYEDFFIVDYSFIYGAIDRLISIIVQLKYVDRGNTDFEMNLFVVVIL